MARKPKQSVSGEPLAQVKVTKRRWSLKQMALCTLASCIGCWALTILLPTTPRAPVLPTSASLLTEVADAPTVTELDATKSVTPTLTIILSATHTPPTFNATETELFLTRAAIVTVMAQSGTVSAAAASSAPVMPTATITEMVAPLPSATIVTPIPTVAAFEPFDETMYAVKIMDSLFIGAGGRDVGTVRIADGRANGGERVAIVTYETTETMVDAQIEEIAELYQSIGISINMNDLDVDGVSLIMGVNGQAMLIMAATAADTVAFSSGHMTRADFLGALITTDLTNTEQSSSGAGNQQGSVMFLSATT